MFQILSMMSKMQLKNRVVNLRKDSIMKKQFNIKAAIWGGLAALLATALIVSGLIISQLATGNPKAKGTALILCGVSFISGMFYFGRKTVSEKDENLED